MPIVRFILALGITGAFLFLFDRPLHLGEQTLPPLGPFFSPQHGFWQNAEDADHYKVNQSRSVSGLDDDIQVIYDTDLVPHIYAQSNRDAAFAQGYIAASLRLFQMDLSSRAPVGRLSEVLGERTLEYDLRQRRKGLARTADSIAVQWQRNPQTKELMDAFVHGVNARIEEYTPASLPVEFKLLDYTPEPWTYQRTAAFFLAMCETLARTADDIPTTNAFRIVGPTDFDLLYPATNPYDSPIISDTAQSHPPLLKSDNGSVATDFSSPPSGSGFPAGIGSNNWAVAGWRTRDGHPILCNDPHLELTLPSIWLEMQITTPDYSAYGVSFPALPGIPIGFNRDIAWGFTNAGHDVLDWYAIRWTDAEKKNYLLDGQATPAELVVEEVLVRGRPEPVLDTVRYTYWGPVTNLTSGTPLADLALHWLPLEETDPEGLLIFRNINAAHDYSDWLSAVSNFDVPMQNGLFASRSGDIALRVSGLLPLRQGHDGRLVQDGTARSIGWQGFVPDSLNPQLVNPAQGWIGSANQRSTGPAYPFPYTGDFENWRGRYLHQRLAELDSVTLEDMMALQNDNTSLLALVARDTFLHLLDTASLTATETFALQSIKTWDGRYDALNNVPVLFQLWFDQVKQLTWDEFATARDSIPVQLPDDWRLLELLSQAAALPYFDRQDTPQVETSRDIIRQAFQAAVALFTERSANGTGHWAAFQSTGIRHLARIPAFSALDIEVGGHHSALNATTSTNGPSWRMIVELGPEIRGLGVYPGGQSGNPGSPYYRHFLPIWQKGEYRDLHYWPAPPPGRDHILSSLDLKKS